MISCDYYLLVVVCVEFAYLLHALTVYAARCTARYCLELAVYRAWMFKLRQVKKKNLGVITKNHTVFARVSAESVFNLSLVTRTFASINLILLFL